MATEEKVGKMYYFIWFTLEVAKRMFLFGLFRRCFYEKISKKLP